MRININKNFLVTLLLLPTLAHANLRPGIKPEIISNIFSKVKANTNWKEAIVTGESTQVVLMSISPQTNPENEIGIDTNECDLIVIVLEGNGKTHLNDKVSDIKENDMIFIPEGTAYNIINVDKNKPLKLICIFSETDVSPGTVLETKASIIKD
jgi:mannose-6-phosphate isomerase-like protein (cupin superfamily)